MGDSFRAKRLDTIKAHEGVAGMDELGFMTFQDMRKEVMRSKLREPWMTIYERWKDEKEDLYVRSGLIPNKEHARRKVLKDTYWEADSDCDMPGYWISRRDGRIHYEQFLQAPRGVRFEPLVIVQSFYGLKPEYAELREEFRLYYNAFYDPTKQEYVFITESGEEHIVAKMQKAGNNIKIQAKTEYLRGFLFAKAMLLVRSHNHVRYSTEEVPLLSESNCANLETIGADFCFKINVDHLPAGEKWKTRSIFLGKDILPPLSQPLPEVRNFASGKRCKEFVDFIIGVDEEFRPVTRSCNPNTLSDFFGKNPGAPHYLTPVYFGREVLKEYFGHPAKYEIEDNLIRCGNLWSLHYDVNSSGLVIVYLGDLGRDLPHNEQLQWKRFNVPPEGGISEKMFKRDVLAQFTEPDEITQIFKHDFEEFSDRWKSKFGWNLFLPLTRDDEHYFKVLHIPTTEDPYEFEEQISALAKILQASINEGKLKELLGKSEESGSINLLQMFLSSFLGVEAQEARSMLQPLRNIQSLRSEGIAHRKGQNYDEIVERLGLRSESSSRFFERIMTDVIQMLRRLSLAARIG